jgi:hypothetical protein
LDQLVASAMRTLSNAVVELAAQALKEIVTTG